VTNHPRLTTRRLALPVVGLCAGAAFYGLAFPPFDQAWLAWISLVPLMLVVQGRSTMNALLYGAVYGIACGYGVSHWLVLTMTRFFGLPLLLAVAGSTVYGVAFWAPPFGIFAAGAARLVGTGGPVLTSLAIAALWVATELLRGRVLAQPWALIGYSQHSHIALIQISAVTAVYGVSFLVALGNATIAEAIVRRGRQGLGETVKAVGVTVGIVAVVWIGGAVIAGKHLPAPTHSVALVQTNVPPAVHWTRAYTDRQVMEHTLVTDKAIGEDDVTLIVWPENAVPRYLETEPGLAAHLGALAQRHGADLLFGAPRYAAGRSYNSVRLVTAAGRNGGHYDKHRLVFVAEANPLRPAWSEEPPDSPHQFTAGDGSAVLRSFVPLGVSICHEVLFPELAASAVREGAALLVNVSNDGWLDAGNGIASSQHFAMAAFRAVETRRYLVRAATTGISGVFDPYGRLLASLPSGTAGVLREGVHEETWITPYVYLGDLFALGCVVVATVALVRCRTTTTGSRRHQEAVPRAG
jgi:apolipoprotein N-acyltransferase